jgi:hypothetical protein
MLEFLEWRTTAFLIMKEDLRFEGVILEVVHFFADSAVEIKRLSLQRKR